MNKVRVEESFGYPFVRDTDKRDFTKRELFAMLEELLAGVGDDERVHFTCDRDGLVRARSILLDKRDFYGVRAIVLDASID